MARIITENAVTSEAELRRLLQRTLVIGTSASGKSTFAHRLAEKLCAEHIELDALHWGPRWTPRSSADFFARIARSTATDAWVVDGNYLKAREQLWPRATAVVWLNYSFPRVFYRGFARSLQRAMRGEILFSGNRESFRRTFLSRESILWWILTTFHRRRREFRLLERSTSAQLAWFELSTPRDGERLLESLTTPSPRAKSA